MRLDPFRALSKRNTPKSPDSSPQKLLDDRLNLHATSDMDRRVKTVSIERMITRLPHTIIISDLGTWNQTFALQFNHFLPENPSIAVFSVGQSAQVPIKWATGQGFDSCSLRFKFQWRPFFLKMRLPCSAKVTVRRGWQCRVGPWAIRNWDPETGVILVDWIKVYEDYYCQYVKKKERNTAPVFAEGYRKLE